MPHLLRNSLYSACPKSPGKMRAGTVESFSIADGLRVNYPANMNRNGALFAWPNEVVSELPKW